MEFKTDIKVRYAETDKMGIVHHCNYGIWFELARTELMSFLGLPYTQIESDGYMLPVTELHVEYKKSIFFGDIITIILTIEKIKGASFKIDYIVEKENVILAKAYTKHVFINSDGIPIRPHKEFVRKIQEVLIPSS